MNKNAKEIARPIKATILSELLREQEEIIETMVGYNNNLQNMTNNTMDSLYIAIGIIIPEEETLQQPQPEDTSNSLGTIREHFKVIRHQLERLRINATKVEYIRDRISEL